MVTSRKPKAAARQPSTTRARAAYMRPESSGTLATWRPATRDASEDVRASWQLATARAIDALHNSGWLAGGIEQATVSIVGSGLRLNSNPDVDALKWKREKATKWAQAVERRWEAWSNNPLECDVGGRLSIGQMTATVIRSWFAYGEIVAMLRNVPRPESETELKVQLVPPHRLSQDTQEFAGLHQGVFVDANGMPVGYRFRARKAGFDFDLDVKARDNAGRQQVIHVFDGAPDQFRGITPLAPALKIVRQYDQLADATLTTTLLQTIFAATLKSQALSNEAFEGLMTETEGDANKFDTMMEARAKWLDSLKIDLGQHGRINHLFPGDELEFHSSSHPHDNYQSFSRGLLREVARCVGITYEQLTGDFEGTTYSSIQMGGSDLWQIVDYRRRVLAVRFVTAIYEAWLDEEVRTGRIRFPGGYEAFRRLRPAACRADWMGPAKPVADDFKAARAMQIRLESKVTSLAYEAAKLGLDAEDVTEQRARESAHALAIGVPDPHAPKAPNGVDPLDEQDDGPPPRRGSQEADE